MFSKIFLSVLQRPALSEVSLTTLSFDVPCTQNFFKILEAKFYTYVMANNLRITIKLPFNYQFYTITACNKLCVLLNAY